MSLSDGTRLGAYEITGRIGAGGMGEVYRASDSRLGREVAIKTLPAALASDKDRLARFEREAKLLAALNHAHIASVYSLDEHEGTLYLAMELVEGETLEDKLKGGPLPIEDALSVALQVAEALEAAHAKGVIHRDLKPANVMVTPDGVVKVLDFGLAKAFSGDPNEASPLHSPTLSLAMAQQELVLGTAGYLSPEQASNQATDQRADVWALGVVLYEMLTGMPVFEGESVPHLLAAVLQAEPDWSCLPRNLHPRVKHVLELCLKKKLRDRYHSIADVRIEIESVLRDPDGVEPAMRASGAVGPRRLATVVTFAVAITAGVAALLVWMLWPTPEPRRAFHFVETVDLPSIGFRLRITRDGTRIAFEGGDSGMIYVRDFGRFGVRPLTDTETNPSVGLASFCFSPDGAWIAYAAAGGLRRAPVTGGPGRTISESTFGSFFGCAWTDDGYIYALSRIGIQRVSASGGEPEPIWEWDRADGRGVGSLLQILPGGTKILLGNWRPVDEATRSFIENIMVVDLESGERTTILEDVGYARFVASGSQPGAGHLVFGRDNAILAAPFDLSRLELDPAVLVVEGVLGFFAVSETGTLAYFSDDSIGEPSYTPLLDIVDRDGAATALNEAPGRYAGVWLSPDGRRIVSARQTSDLFLVDLWVHELAGEPPRRLTSEALNHAVVWMPDGERLIYHEFNLTESRVRLVMIPVDGSAPPETLATFDGVTQFEYVPTSISPDGTTLMGENDGDIWLLPLIDRASAATQQDVSYFLQTDFDARDARFSPDGRFVAYTSDETGGDEVYVLPYPGPGPKTRVSVDGGSMPRWNPAGGELFYLEDTSVMVADVETDGGFDVRSARVLFEDPTVDVSEYDVTPDGTQFVMLRRPAETGSDDSVELRVVRNWSEELNRLVPIE